MSPEVAIPEDTERYRHWVEINRGGMCIVFKAYDSKLDKWVALKTLLDDYKDDKEVVKRFFLEARRAQDLTHQNILNVYDLVMIHDTEYIVMEYIDGKNLLEMLDPGKAISLDMAESMIVQICEGLAYAHSHKLVHRDIKPQNLLINQWGIVKIADFGISKVLEETGITKTRQTPGTPKYMSPEQIMGRRIDQRTDIFSLGIVMYQLVTGNYPFPSNNKISLLDMIISIDVKTPSALRPDLPHAWDKIIMKCLAKKPDNRYHRCEEIVRDIENIARVREKKSNVYPKPVDPKHGKSPRKPPYFMIATILLVLLSLGGGAGLWKHLHALKKDRFDMLMLSAKNAMLEYDYANARQEYQEAAKLFPEDHRLKEKIALFQAYDSSIRSGDNRFAAAEYKDSIRYYERALEILPLDQDALEKLGLAQSKLPTLEITLTAPGNEETVKHPSCPDHQVKVEGKLSEQTDNPFYPIVKAPDSRYYPQLPLAKINLNIDGHVWAGSDENREGDEFTLYIYEVDSNESETINLLNTVITSKGYLESLPARGLRPLLSLTLIMGSPCNTPQ